MRDYGKVAPQFWTGETGKALKAAGPEAVIVAMYLMTSPHANMIGLYYLPVLYIAHETGLGFEGASKGLQGAIEAGFCSYDAPSEHVFVHAMARFQVGEQLKPDDKRCKGIQNELDRVSKCPLVKDFCQIYSKAYHVKSPSPLQAPSKPRAGAGTGAGESKERDKSRTPPVTFATWMENLPEGEDAIPPDDPIFQFAADAGIPDDLLALAWAWFERSYTGSRKAKRYSDWRQVFRNAVEGNWPKVWRFQPDGTCVLTSEGEMLRRALEAEARRAAP